MYSRNEIVLMPYPRCELMATLMQVNAVIRKEKFPDVDLALKKVGVGGLTVTEAQGRGRDKLTVTYYARGKWTYSTEYMGRVMVSIVVDSQDVDKVVAAIIESASTKSVGDGKIFVLPVGKAFDLASGKADDCALVSPTATQSGSEKRID